MIYNKYLEGGIAEKWEDIWGTIKQRISFKSVFFVVLSILLANQTFVTDIAPFNYVLLGVASVFNVPLILVLLSSSISLAVGGMTAIVFAKLIAFFIAFTLITAFVNIEGISRRYSVFIKFIISFFGVELIFSFINGTIISQLFANLGNVLIVSILYFIFVSGTYVLVNLRKGYIYSKEESIAMITVLALSLTVFSPIVVFGYSIVNILVMVLILIYGWKNGSVTACAAGLIVGLFLTAMIQLPLSYVVALAFSGLIAGILSKFGKLSVVLGFIIGNVYIAYYSHNFSEVTMRVSELVIASVSLLFMPKVIERTIEKLFNKNKTLSSAYENVLDAASDVKNKVGAISDVFDSLADITIDTTPEDEKETREVIKRYIVDYIDNTCIDCNKRKDCTNTEKLEMTVDYMASKLENNEVLDKTMLMRECDLSEQLIQDIKEVYGSMKLMRILKKKEQENTNKISHQYKEVSKILANISRSIKNVPMVEDKTQTKLRDELKFYGYLVYEDELKREENNIEYTFVTDILTNIDKQKKEIVALASNILEQNVTIKLILNSSKKEKSRIKLVSKPDYEISTSISSDMKSSETISGDSYLTMELQDLKQLCVLSDGAGSGVSAAKGSQTVINMLEKLLDGGFDEQKAVEIINSIIKLKGDDNKFSTLDAFLFNLKNAHAEFIKLGAAPTYILQDGKITIMNNINIPLGLVKDTEYVPICKELSDNTIVVQMTDGVVTENMDIQHNFVTKYLQGLDSFKTAKMIAEDIHKLVLKEHKGDLQDDMTVIVSKVKKVQ